MTKPRDIVIAWDIFDGDVLGAVMECSTCEGGGRVTDDDPSDDAEIKTCPTCDGSGELHRQYTRPPEGYYYDRRDGWLNPRYQEDPTDA